MTDLKVLIARRGTIKGQVTRFKSFLEQMSDGQTNELQIRLEAIERLVSEFNEVQLNIELLNPEEVDSNSREEFEGVIFQVMARAKAKIAESVMGQQQNVNQGTLQIKGGPNGVQVDTGADLELRKFNLPYFSGEYDKWYKFKNTFISLIHNNKKFDKVQKFYRLLECLKGDAEKVLAELEVSSENYDVAWAMLEERFEDKPGIIQKHLKALVDLEVLKYDSVSELRKMLDNFNSHWRALKSLGEPIDKWDRILILLMSRKIVGQTKKLWEEARVSKFKGEPSIEEFKKFLVDRCKSLEAYTYEDKDRNMRSGKKDIKAGTYVATNYEIKCKFCKGQHSIYSCEKLKELPVENRWQEIKQLRLCINCLRANHFAKDCRSDGCKLCGFKHSVILHRAKGSIGASSSAEQAKSNGSGDSHKGREETPTQEVRNNGNASLGMAAISPSSVITAAANTSKLKQVLLPTVVAHVLDRDGREHKVRCLLDSGSQTSFMTNDCVKRLKLQTSKVNLPIVGISRAQASVNRMVQAKIRSCKGTYETEESFLILEKITAKIPGVSFDKSKIMLHKNIDLADERFNIADEIDILLSARILLETLCDGRIKSDEGLPILQETLFGWIVGGVLTNKHEKENIVQCNLSVVEELDAIEKFWKLEEWEAGQSEVKLSKEEIECERMFSDTIYRDADGKFVVTLPIKENMNELGQSLAMAERRLESMERKFEKDLEFKEAYVNFMREYSDMGHMTKIGKGELERERMLLENTQIYYLPHHGVVNKSSATTKLRVVFDGSCKSSSNVSLNEVLKVGPSIQDDVFTVLCRFRKYNVVITSDIAKMYRMVKVVEPQRNLQRIVWRENKNDALGHYRLNTITYGTGPASFLAMRCLKQIALDVKDKYPEAARLIERDFYMDDLITGGETVRSTVNLANIISGILREYGFNLRKWNSNEQEVLQHLSVNSSNSEGHFIKDSDLSKTLGIFWNAKDDAFEYLIDSDMQNYSKVTKRIILSSIARIFDPLGLVGPIIVKAKIFMQQLWQLKVGWDEEVPLEIDSNWREFARQLKTLQDLKIPRQVTIKDYTVLELHGFSDASQKASGACIFIRSIDKGNSVSVRLLCSKSRVAPLRTISIPKLELCGAVLLARLMKKVKAALGIKLPAFYWCDSTIVLCWLAEEPHVWKPFVANRVSEIQSNTEIDNWNHVSSGENPADVISRGANAADLKNFDLWWRGPQFLREHIINSERIGNKSDVPERRKPKQISLASNIAPLVLINKYSTLTKLLRVTGWCLRFIKNSKLTRNTRVKGKLSVDELDNALKTLIKSEQARTFDCEISNLCNGKLIPVKSKIKSLDPFLGSDQLLRVGGRLRKIPIEYDRKFQIILPYKCHLTNLIIQHEHFRQLHAGPQAILNSVRQRFWPINGRRAVRSVLAKCMVCFRSNPIPSKQKMGDLPIDRITPNRPFYICGTDFAGPFFIKDGKLRNRAIIKAYMCIFICLVTKAVHIEAVGDLSAEAFLNCFKRFTSRRGLCKRVYSDNATNYRGSYNYIRDMQNFLLSIKDDENMLKFCEENRIEWVFIPAKSPHQGGIWESAVKSAKYHVVRIVGTNNLLFEELVTVFSQVEAVLNSRPITALSPNPGDLSPLTPGHFLIGSPLTALPEAQPPEKPMNKLTRYQLLQKMVQDFWSRWSHDYLSSLQERKKWRSPIKNLCVGDLVILKEDHLSPLHWKLGRILETHPGSDGAVRVVTLKTPSGVVKRSVQRVCALPIYSE